MPMVQEILGMCDHLKAQWYWGRNHLGVIILMMSQTKMMTRYKVAIFLMISLVKVVAKLLGCCHLDDITSQDG